MTRFDTESLLTNIPLEEYNIDICVNKLFKSESYIKTLTKTSFRNLLELGPLESFFLFNGIYKQKDGVAMSSVLGPTLASVFLCNFKNQWLFNYSSTYLTTHFHYISMISVIFT